MTHVLDFYPAFRSRSNRRLLAIRGRNERKAGEEMMRIVSLISESDIGVTHLLL